MVGLTDIEVSASMNLLVGEVITKPTRLYRSRFRMHRSRSRPPPWSEEIERTVLVEGE